MVWLSFLVVLQSVTLGYEKENKTVKNKIGVKESLYAFVFFWSVRTSKIVMNI